MTAPMPRVFAQPWHAEVFALTVALQEAGHFEWSDWAHAFAAKLREHGAESELDGGDDYFLAWVSALEGFLQDRRILTGTQLHEMKTLWAEAYLNTPHGQPVYPRQSRGA